ncbi:hypothetical protein BD626DRAFT_512145, partial [Schizophyllum amplum]
MQRLSCFEILHALWLWPAHPIIVVVPTCRWHGAHPPFRQTSRLCSAIIPERRHLLLPRIVQPTLFSLANLLNVFRILLSMSPRPNLGFLIIIRDRRIPPS